MGLGTKSVYAQNGGEQYFPETGHYVTDEFYEFYASIENAKLIFGYPITEAFVNSFGIRVQYFQRARFELHPEKPLGHQVVVSELGNYLYVPGAPLRYTLGDACQKFSADKGFDYPVCFAFLDFYLENDGESYFGLPISDIEWHGDYLMQYFERTRLEWHPEYPPGKKVTVGHLGEIYFQMLDLDLSLRAPVDFIDSGIQPDAETIDITGHAFVQSAVVTPGEEQIIFVTVRDQKLEPVQGIQVMVEIYFPNGESHNIGFPSVNHLGFTQQTFRITSTAEPGLVKVLVRIGSNGSQETVQTSFRVWR
jgi:hypothetical protein